MNDNSPANPVRQLQGRMVPIIGVVADDTVTITNPSAWARIRRRLTRPSLRLVKSD